MNKKQCLATKYHESKMKPKKNNHHSLIEKQRATSFSLSTQSVTLDVL